MPGGKQKVQPCTFYDTQKAVNMKNNRPEKFRGEVTLRSAQDYAVVHLPGGSAVTVYGDGTRGASTSAAIRRRPGYTLKPKRWQKHVLALTAALMIAVAPGAYLSASTNAGHRNAPALTAALTTLTAIGVAATIALVVTMIILALNGDYKVQPCTFCRPSRASWHEP